MFKKISVIIPVFNEEGNIKKLVFLVAEEFSKITAEYELIFVNDASTDRTQKEIKSLEKKYGFLKVLNFKKRSGQSKAIWEGFSMATGDIIITMDGDLQNDPRDIPIFMKNIKNFKMVTGVRNKRQDNLVRNISSMAANYIRRIVLKSNILDSACGYRAFNRCCLERIEFFDGIHRFLPDLFLAQGFSVKQVAINHLPRTSGQSKYGIWGRAIRAGMDLIRVKWHIIKIKDKQ
jgi:glycosyltransferase involved in cell wall biosynthesis